MQRKEIKLERPAGYWALYDAREQARRENEANPTPESAAKLAQAAEELERWKNDHPRN